MPVFVSSGIDSQPGGPIRQPYLSYRPARLHRLADKCRIDSSESIPGIHKRLQIRALILVEKTEPELGNVEEAQETIPPGYAGSPGIDS